MLTGRNDITEKQHIAKELGRRISAGPAHVMAVSYDNKLLIDDHYKIIGQRFDAEENIIGVASGVSHGVVLLRNGTVKAAGKNSFHECDVSQWKNITAIAAADYYTIGIHSDGTAVIAGQYKHVGGWQNIVRVVGNRLCAYGLKADGTVVLAYDYKDYYGSSDVCKWENITDIACGELHCVGLQSDGHVVVDGMDIINRREVRSWDQIIAVAAGYRHTVGLRSNGTVVAAGSNDEGQCNVAQWTDVVAIAAGGDRTLGLRSDGTFLLAGDFKKDSIQNISAWNILRGSNRNSVITKDSMTCYEREEMMPAAFGRISDRSTDYIVYPTLSLVRTKLLARTDERDLLSCPRCSSQNFHLCLRLRKLQCSNCMHWIDIAD